MSFFRPLDTLRRHLVLAAQAVLLALPFVLYGHSWTGVAGLVAGNALLVLRPVVGWTVFVTTVAATALTQATHDDPMTAVAVTALLLAGLATGFATHRTTPPDQKAPPVVAVVDATVAAVAAERVRLARDLHDLLGYSLSAIKLKSELAHRIVTDRPDRDWDFVREHIVEIMDLTHNALADVRSLARAYRPISLADTSDSAKAMLAASNIDVRVQLSHDPLPETVETVLAAVLCEAVTNVLRHSDASTCTIDVRQRGATILLDVINDGAAERAVSADCNGVRNQAERVHAAGGTFTARHVGDGSFHVHATVPAALPPA
ncbi:sensor histidine kinase [Lentzea sp. CC55]|uniref:sensor histidine kinase n=1 Tax=Lentzea sp. CC55 TaxID=2884909 RepID=UPI0027E15156|nr:histidine kinase [Lentzea sp. CC55]MCG8926737.1 histidine kinase [Lentzea sp. CC55]